MADGKDKTTELEHNHDKLLTIPYALNEDVLFG